jgi:hypothetical protein
VLDSFAKSGRKSGELLVEALTNYTDLNCLWAPSDPVLVVM